MSANTKPPSPARLSAISTSLLTAILELSQQNADDLRGNTATKTTIVGNLLALKAGLIRVGVENSEEIVVGLRSQYARIVGLVRGLGAMDHELDGLDLALPAAPVHDPSPPQPLILVDEPSAPSPHRTPQQSGLPDLPIHIPARYRSRKAIEEDEELMRSENEQVQRIQNVLLDDQDRTLDDLSNAISRQRDLSLHISSELEVQENLLDELDENLDFTSNRLARTSKKMENLFDKIAKDGACWTIFGLVALLLFLIVLLK